MSERGTEPTASAPAVAGELRVILGQLIRRLREQNLGNDLTKTQSAVLSRLEREGAATATELARAEGLRQQSMAKIVQALTEAGLVSGSPDPRDGRKTVLRITDLAREQYRSGRMAREDWLTHAIEATLSAEEIERLAATTDLLRRLTQAP